MLHYEDSFSTFNGHMTPPALSWGHRMFRKARVLVVWHKINVLSSHDICCVSWGRPEESLVFPLGDLKFHVCKEETLAWPTLPGYSH